MTVLFSVALHRLDSGVEPNVWGSARIKAGTLGEMEEVVFEKMLHTPAAMAEVYGRLVNDGYTFLHADEPTVLPRGDVEFILAMKKDESAA